LKCLRKRLDDNFSTDAMLSLEIKRLISYFIFGHNRDGVTVSFLCKRYEKSNSKGVLPLFTTTLCTNISSISIGVKQIINHYYHRQNHLELFDLQFDTVLIGEAYISKICIDNKLHTFH
jgi:hypothetical protein